MSFDVSADAYTRFMGRYSEPLAARFADLAGVRRGQRALDVGCGPGALTAELVRRAGVDAVSAVEPSASFAAAVRERLPGVDVRRSAAEQLPFPDHTFDAAAAQLVVHFMTDPVLGLREMGRVTRPGGMVAACVWDHAGGRGPLAAFWSAARELDPAADDESDLPGVREGHLAALFAQAGLGQATARRTGFSPNFIDYDNDGRLDLFVTCGGVQADDMAPPDATYEQNYGQPALLLANDGKGHFVDVSDLAGPYFQRRLIGRGSAAGDIDNDGDIDLVVNNLEGPAVVLRNDTPGGHWVTLRLLPPRGDAPVIGAKVHLTAGGKTLYAITRSEGGYLSVNDRRVHFGLGSVTRVDSVEIVWPGGTKQILHDQPIDVITTIRQPSGKPDGAEVH